MIVQFNQDAADYSRPVVPFSFLLCSGKLEGNESTITGKVNGHSLLGKGYQSALYRMMPAVGRTETDYKDHACAWI